MIGYDTQERHLIVPAKGGRGGDSGAGFGLNFYDFDGTTGFTRLSSLGGRNLDECRQAAFHPNGEMVYLLNEKRNVVIVLQYDAEKGEAVPIQMVQSLPSDVIPWDLEIAEDSLLCAANMLTGTIGIFDIQDKNTLPVKLGEIESPSASYILIK